MYILARISRKTSIRRYLNNDLSEEKEAPIMKIKGRAFQRERAAMTRYQMGKSMGMFSGQQDDQCG